MSNGTTAILFNVKLPLTLVSLVSLARSPPWSGYFVSGDTIIRQGDDDRSLFKFYIVEDGEARAYVMEEGEDVLMSHLGPGKFQHAFESN